MMKLSSYQPIKILLYNFFEFLLPWQPRPKACVCANSFSRSIVNQPSTQPNKDDDKSNDDSHNRANELK